jgi:hypothetical protein
VCLVGRWFDLSVVLHRGNFVIWFQCENDMVAHNFFLFATWEATTVAFVELKHSLAYCSSFSALCVIWFVWPCNWSGGAQFVFVQIVASSRYYVFEWCIIWFFVVVATSVVWFVSTWKRSGDTWNCFLFGAWHVRLSTWCYFLWFVYFLLCRCW